MAVFPAATEGRDRVDSSDAAVDPTFPAAPGPRGRARFAITAAVLGLAIGGSGVVSAPGAGAVSKTTNKTTKQSKTKKGAARRWAARRRAATVAALSVLPAGSAVAPSAAVLEPPARPEPPDGAGALYLELTNSARAQGRSRGGVVFAPAPPLRWDRRLVQAAVENAQEQQAMGALSHRGPDGSDPGTRATRTGYAWSVVGENVAWGQPDAATVMRDWLDSPHHCANIMDPRFAQMGMAQAGAYWAQELGAPR